MQKIKESVDGKLQWSFLTEKIDLIESLFHSNQNDAIGHLKDLIESIAKTILVDHNQDLTDLDLGPLVKKSIRLMSFYGRLEGRDQELTIRLASSMTSIFLV